MSWGPPTWLFLHCLAEKINPDHYLLVKDKLWGFIKELCSTLPCPDCSSHAVTYLSKIPTPPSKIHFVHAIYTFHNVVNQKTAKQPFPMEKLSHYKSIPLSLAYFLYKKTLHQPYNPKLMMHKMRSKQFILHFQTWLQQQKLL